MRVGELVYLYLLQGRAKLQAYMTYNLANHQGHDVDVDPMPSWFQPQEHQALADDELIMTSFKWNVHNHGRTMNLKRLAEIVHTNPAWMNPKTATKFGLKDGDWIELTSYYSQELEQQSPHLRRDDLPTLNGRRFVGTLRVPIVTMQGIHPRLTFECSVPALKQFPRKRSCG